MHGCAQSSASKKIDRHELCKHARAHLIKLVGLDNVKIEPRLKPGRSQRRADISYIDKSILSRQIYYYTDDTIGHPLCPVHLAGEAKSSGTAYTLKKLTKNKYAILGNNPLGLGWL